jgi:hypothetical protein
LKQDTLKPSQGITKSVKTPGSATRSVPQAGTTNVTGQGASSALGSVSGIDYSALVPALTSGGATSVTPASLGLNTAAQAVLALSNVSTGIQGNKAGQLIAALVMGGLSLAQGAWDQNSLARANNGAQWNQVLMTTLMTAKLFNQRGVNILGGSSGASNILTFLPSQATFITPVTIPDNNAIVIPIQ